MEASLKKILKSVTLELRHLLEGRYDIAGVWQPGDLETRLASIGVRGDRNPRPADELQLTTEDQHARKVVDAYLKLREEAGVPRAEAVAEFLRETAYTWANRLIALRCMESRDLIDSVILQQEAYGGRSLEHHRLAQRQPELCAGEDDGLFGVLDKVFREQAERLPMLFDPQSPGVVLRPSPAAIKDCFGLLSLNSDSLRKYRIRIKEDENANADADAEPPNPFIAPDALGWTYQYWNTEEKDRVFETVRTVKGAKISGADIVPATQLYTEDYMVKFLVQNSLGAIWMGLHPESRLSDGWVYYVRDADRAPPADPKPVREITFLDPACGSGHFLLEAFDLFYAMYEGEGNLSEPAEICNAILTQNLFGIDIDARAVQIAEAALWMKAADRVFDYSGAATNLVAATASHLKGPAWEEFLSGFEREPSVARVLRKFAKSMEHIDEIGSLARPAEDLREIIRDEHVTWERQIRARQEANYLFPEMTAEALSDQLPFHEISDSDFGDRLFFRATAGIDAFTERARASGEFEDQLLGTETRSGFRLVELLSRKYDVVAANPPYMTVYSMGDRLREWLTVAFPGTYYDLYSAFLQRGVELAGHGGSIAFVAQSSFLTIRNYTSLRTLLLESAVPAVVADLGTGAFSEITGAKVNVLLYVGCGTDTNLPACFLDLREATDKGEGLSSSTGLARVHRVVPNTFTRIPRSPFIYSMPESLRHLLSADDSFRQHGQAYLGLKTANNAKYCRMAWETPNSGRTARRWKPLVSETNSWPYYCDSFACVSFREADIAYFREHVSAQIYNKSLWDRPGLTFGAAAGRGFDVKVLDEGVMVLNSSNLILLDDVNDRDFLVGVLNSTLFRVLMNLLNPTINNTPGDVHRLPWPSVTKHARKCIEESVTSICKAIATLRATETESAIYEFQLGNGGSLAIRAEHELALLWEAQRRMIRAKADIERAVADNLLMSRDDLDFILGWTESHLVT